MWHEEPKPNEWELGILLKIAKRGDLADCSNYRGMTLTSVVMKVYNVLILKRLEKKVDESLRDEQAGFRKDQTANLDLTPTTKLLARNHSIKTLTIQLEAGLSFDKGSQNMGSKCVGEDNAI
ncbi:uncharacterized protein [Palaemon carinicauda]|uniref:uncharacterized protein n=1 Tax=Palaemon carinicauda TaxID=392227 RepID=UPI0035B5DA89